MGYSPKGLTVLAVTSSSARTDFWASDDDGAEEEGPLATGVGVAGSVSPP